MPFQEIDLQLLVCMFRNDRIGRHHANIENILNFCTPKEYRDSRSMGRLKKRLRRLAGRGYLVRKVGRFEAYSLSMNGVRVVQNWQDGMDIEQINELEDTRT